MNTPIDHEAEGAVRDDTAALLHRRSELLDRRRSGAIDDDAIAELDRLTAELTRRVESGEPSVRRLLMDTDAELLARLAAMEPVHPLDDPADTAEIRARVEGDHHCYVLENRKLVGHPLNVVWVALRRSLPAGMSDVLGPDTPPVSHDPTPDGDDTVGAAATGADRPTTAVFYSIWNVEAGLAGIPGGSALLGLVMDRLSREYPSLDTFTTLSPIPGLTRWIRARMPELADQLERVRISGDQQTSIIGDEDVSAGLGRVCAQYLSTLDDRGLPIDDVARFHMRNGARLWRLVPGADRSGRGWDRSFGMMVNYRYGPEDLDANRSSLAARRPVMGESVLTLVDHDGDMIQ